MLKLEFDGVIDMKIREVNENKKQFIALLLFIILYYLYQLSSQIRKDKK